MAAARAARRTPWRDNLEAMAMAIIMALLLKGFIVEAYKIPTGSMQPTLIGDDAMGVHDRILVDKLSFSFRDPERFEVVVFRYPLDRSKNFVKRLVGIGPEDFRIRYGDLWHRSDGDAPWEILRRPRGVQDAAWKDLEPDDPDRPAWTVESGAGWSASDHTLTARGDGSARWRPELGTVRDGYWDGYDPALLATLDHRIEKGRLHAVGDLRLVGTVSALPGTRAVVLELDENERAYRFVLPGPAAPADARARIEVRLGPGAEGSAPAGAELDHPWRLPAGRPVQLAVQNMDDLLELRLDGDWVLAAEIGAVNTATSGARIEVAGEGADLRDLRLARDIYYTATSTREPYWRIPAGEYFMLGDNTLDSSDSREWTFERYEVPADLVPGARPDADGEVILRANSRRGENPVTFGYGDPDGPTLGLRDEWGDEHFLPAHAARRLSPEAAPFVPRDMVLGRALAVFWPVDPTRGINQLGWIR